MFIKEFIHAVKYVYMQLLNPMSRKLKLLKCSFFKIQSIKQEENEKVLKLNFISFVLLASVPSLYCLKVEFDFY